jgi:hypothetical protein
MWGLHRTAFFVKDCYPKIFFIGAAIENTMANEIYKQYNCILSNTANLTPEDQVVSLCDWRVKL